MSEGCGIWVLEIILALLLTDYDSDTIVRRKRVALTRNDNT